MLAISPTQVLFLDCHLLRPLVPKLLAYKLLAQLPQLVRLDRARSPRLDSIDVRVRDSAFQQIGAVSLGNGVVERSKRVRCGADVAGDDIEVCPSFAVALQAVCLACAYG